MLGAENKKIAEERNPVNVFWTYATTHLWKVLGKERRLHQRRPPRQPLLLSVDAGDSEIQVPHGRRTADQVPGNEPDTIRGWKPAKIDVVEE